MALAERSERETALKLLDKIACSEVDAGIATSSLEDVYFILSKYASEADARKYVGALMELVDLVAPDERVCQTAILSDEPDFEDGIIRACAESYEADFIISRRTDAFERAWIKRLSAEDYLKYFGEAKTS